MSIYEQIANAPVYGGGSYILEGEHLFLVQDVRIINSQRENNVQYGIIQCKCVNSSNPEMSEGAVYSARIKSSTPSFQSNMKNASLAIGKAVFEGFDEENVDAEFIQQVWDDWQGFLDEHFEGDEFFLKCQASMVKTREGKDFTKLYWYAPDEDFGSRGPGSDDK